MTFQSTLHNQKPALTRGKVGGADPSVGGYLDVSSNIAITMTVPPEETFCYDAMGIESPNGAAVGGTCTDGWDAQMFEYL